MFGSIWPFPKIRCLGRFRSGPAPNKKGSPWGLPLCFGLKKGGLTVVFHVLNFETEGLAMGLEVLQTFADTGTGRFVRSIVKLLEVFLHGGYHLKQFVVFVHKAFI